MAIYPPSVAGSLGFGLRAPLTRHPGTACVVPTPSPLLPCAFCLCVSTTVCQTVIGDRCVITTKCERRVETLTSDHPQNAASPLRAPPQVPLFVGFRPAPPHEYTPRDISHIAMTIMAHRHSLTLSLEIVYTPTDAYDRMDQNTRSLCGTGWMPLGCAR